MLPPLATGEQVWVRDQNQEGQIIGTAKQPRSYLVKTEISTIRRDRSALVTTTYKPIISSKDSTMVLDEPAVAAPHTPPRVYPPKPEEPLAKPTTPLRFPATPAKEGPSNTKNSSAHLSVGSSSGPPGCVTRSGRVVKIPRCLDL